MVSPSLACVCDAIETLNRGHDVQYGCNSLPTRSLKKLYPIASDLTIN